METYNNQKGREKIIRNKNKEFDHSTKMLSFGSLFMNNKMTKIRDMIIRQENSRTKSTERK